MNREGFESFIKDASKIYKNFDISISDASQYFEQNESSAINLLKQADIELGKRGFFSFLGGIVNTIRGAVYTAVTFGQVEETKSMTVESAQQVAKNADGAVQALGGIGEIATGMIDALKGQGEGATSVVDGVSTFVDNAL